MTRKVLGLVAVVGAATFAVGQTPPAPERFGIAANPDAYPQATPKEALASIVRALERGRVDYFAAHLLDPAVADARVADRARVVDADVEREFRQLRDRQRTTTPAGARLPADPAGLDAAVKAEDQRRGFRIFAQDIRATLAENPDHLRDLQRFLREATIAETGDTAKATVKEFKDREVFFRRVGLVWYVLDQRQEPPAR